VHGFIVNCIARTQIKKRTWESGSGGVAEKRVKLTVKGRAAVFPESELADTHHVLERGKDVYSVTLSLTDVARGLNSFYKVRMGPSRHVGGCANSWKEIVRGALKMTQFFLHLQ
jgi:hypothetical protein